MPEPLLRVEDVAITYDHRRFRIPVGPAPARQWPVKGVTLEVASGESVAIVGESGCGKSTLARAIVGLMPMARGSLLFAGEPLGERRTLQQRRHLQLVFQDPYSSLNPRMTVGQTLEEVVRVHRMRTGAQVGGRMRELLDLVNLSSRVADAYPRQLSGGQRQRVSIARALATEPQVLIADEPVSALDVSVQAAILNLFASLRSELGLSVLMISHNLAVVRHVSERIAVMWDGRIVEAGPTATVMNHPQHDYTRTLLEAVPSLVPRVRRLDEPADRPAGKA